MYKIFRRLVSSSVVTHKCVHLRTTDSDLISILPPKLAGEARTKIENRRVLSLS